MLSVIFKKTFFRKIPARIEPQLPDSELLHPRASIVFAAACHFNYRDVPHFNQETFPITRFDRSMKFCLIFHPPCVVRSNSAAGN